MAVFVVRGSGERGEEEVKKEKGVSMSVNSDETAHT
jgi:hypothetical protein